MACPSCLCLCVAVRASPEVCGDLARPILPPSPPPLHLPAASSALQTKGPVGSTAAVQNHMLCVMAWLTRVRQLMQPSKARARQMRKQTRSKHWMRGACVAGACASAPAPTLQRAQGRARAPTAGEGRVLTMPNANGSLQTYAVHARTFTQMHTQMHLRMGAPSPDQRCLASRLSRDDPRTLREAARKLLQRTRTWR